MEDFFMLVDDIIKVSARVKCDTVECGNDMFFKVLAVPLADGLALSLTKLITRWWDTYKEHIANTVILSCATWDNQTRNEIATVYPALPGGTAGDHQPSHSVLNVNCKAWDEAEAAPRTIGAFRQSISGWLESTSTRGRLGAAINVTSWPTFFENVQLVDVDQLSVRPMARHDSAGKAWRDGGKVGDQPTPTYVYIPIEDATVDCRFRTLASRRSRICA